jgi:hypothetical protein
MIARRQAAPSHATHSIHIAMQGLAGCLAILRRALMPQTSDQPVQALPARRLVERELTLAEMLENPIVQLVMRRDRVRPETITALFTPSRYRDAA